MTGTVTTDAVQRTARTDGEAGDQNTGGEPRWGCAALLFGALCVLGFLVALFAHGEVFGRRLPLVSACAVLVLLAKLAVDALSRRMRAPDLPIATSSGAIFVATALAASQWDSMAARLDRLDPEFSGGGHVFGSGLAGAMAFLTTFVLVPMLGLYAGAVPARLAPNPAFRRACRHVAALVTFALAGLVVLTGARAARHPSLDDYLADLQNEGWLSPPGVVTRYGGVSGPRPVAWGPGPTGERRQKLGSLTAVLQCEEAGCRMALVGDSGAPPSMVDHQNAPLQRWDAAIELKRDPATGGLFVLSGHGASLERRAIAEFHHRDGRWVPAPFDPRRITNRASPPVAWVLGGVGGFLLMAVGWLACLKQRRDWARLQRAREGTLGADGWISFQSGPAAQLDGGFVLPPGPVLVFAPSAADGYRGQQHLSPVDVLGGTLAEHEKEMNKRLLHWHAAIMAIATLAGAPLVAAAVTGLAL